ncbi:hypothetical protein BAL199_30527 [alpha proteobacterium BAL199]|nr:hypothetical protein BAL199_30527 [alpha proteobacterium BAL199]
MSLKPVDDGLPLLDRSIPVDQIDPVQAELLSYEFNKPVLHLTMLNEDQGTLTLRLDIA